MTATHRLNIPKTIALLIFIAGTVLLINPVFAQDATSSTKRIEKVKERVETRKEKVETRITATKEKMASREAALKEKLQAFRDKKKAEIAQRVNTNLNKINQNQTDQMQKHLDKMSALLDKLEARVNKASPDIKNPSLAKGANADARAAIASASSAVSAQAEKDYSLEVTTESRVKGEAQAKRDQLHKDLQAVRKQVIDAKQAVANAIRVAKSGKVEVPKEGTSSGQQ